MSEEKYLAMFPWKAKPCSGCGKKFIINEKRKWCDDCRKLIANLPEDISAKFRRGEIDRDTAVAIYRKVEDAKKANSMADSLKCKISGFKEKIGDDEFLDAARRLGSFTCLELALEIQTTVRTTYKYLSRLFAEGKVEKESCGKFVFWRIADRTIYHQKS